MKKYKLTGSAVYGTDHAHYVKACYIQGVSALPTEVCLGRRTNPIKHLNVPRLKDYLKPRYTIPRLPIDWATKAAASLARMYLNDTYGCCVISDSYHRVGVWTGNESGVAQVGTDAEVLATYRIWNPGTEDNGCVIAWVLDYCRDHGISLNGILHRIDGYVSIDWTNWDEVLVALFLFGTLPLGIYLPADWLNNSVWDVTTSQIVGGHAVPIVAALGSDGVDIASWARKYRITKAALTSRTWIEEAYAPLSPDWYVKAQMAPNLIYADALRNDLSSLGQGVIPDIGPQPGPTPVSNSRIKFLRTLGSATYPLTYRGIQVITLNLTETHQAGSISLIGASTKGSPMTTTAQQLARIETLCQGISDDLGIGAPNPGGMQVKTKAAGPGMVTLDFSWTPANDGGVTDHYTLQVDGATVAALSGNVSSFVMVFADDTNAHTATLTSFNSAGVPCNNPASVNFIPHITPAPPTPSDPTNFAVSVNP